MSFVDQLMAPLSSSARARHGVKLLESGRTAQGFRHLARAARSGSIDAQYRVGQCYLEGVGVPQATGEAVRWFERAAEAGSAEAQFYLALLYVRGVSVPKQSGGGAKALFVSDDQSGGSDFARRSNGRAAPRRAVRRKARRFLAIFLPPVRKRSAIRRRRSAGISARRGLAAHKDHLA